MDAEEQRSVVAGLKAGSPDAWRRLYEAYAQRLWRHVAVRIGGDPNTIADIVQETFLSAAKSARRFDARRGTLWIWLWGIAVRQSAPQHRRDPARAALWRARRWLSRNGRDPEMRVQAADTPAGQAAGREIAAAVRTALAELPPMYQTLLAGKYVDNASAEQLAVDTGLSASAVYSKLARARAALRAALVRRMPSWTTDEVQHERTRE